MAAAVFFALEVCDDNLWTPDNPLLGNLEKKISSQLFNCPCIISPHPNKEKGAGVFRVGSFKTSHLPGHLLLCQGSLLKASDNAKRRRIFFNSAQGFCGLGTLPRDVWVAFSNFFFAVKTVYSSKHLAFSKAESG